MEQPPQQPGTVVGIPPGLRMAYRIGFWTGVISLLLLCVIGGSSDYTALLFGTTVIGFIVAWVSNKMIQGYASLQRLQGRVVMGAM